MPVPASDHDMLVRIDERVQSIAETQRTFHSRIDHVVGEIWERLDLHTTQLETLRTHNARTTGVVSGAKWMWGAILAIPGVLAWWHVK